MKFPPALNFCRRRSKSSMLPDPSNPHSLARTRNDDRIRDDYINQVHYQSERRRRRRNRATQHLSLSLFIQQRQRQTHEEEAEEDIHCEHNEVSDTHCSSGIMEHRALIDSKGRETLVVPISILQ